MYQILIDTSLDALLIILSQDHKFHDWIFQPKLLKKSEFLPLELQKLLFKHHLKLQNIEAFYITLGPGSFMGSRVALVFARTICQITNAQLFTINSLLFISQGQDGQYFIDAKSNQSYQGIVKKGKLTMQLISFQPNSKIDYLKIKENFSELIQLFQNEKDLLNVKPYYLKAPKVN